jgi:hypothetical protein
MFLCEDRSHRSGKGVAQFIGTPEAGLKAGGPQNITVVNSAVCSKPTRA